MRRSTESFEYWLRMPLEFVRGSSQFALSKQLKEVLGCRAMRISQVEDNKGLSAIFFSSDISSLIRLPLSIALLTESPCKIPIPMPLCTAAYTAPEFLQDTATVGLAGKTLTLRELAEYPLVIKNPSRFESMLASQGYKMNFAVRCETSQAVKTAVRAGLGIGILFQTRLRSSLPRGVLN